MPSPATWQMRRAPLPHPRGLCSPAGSPQRGGHGGGRPEPGSPGPDYREEPARLKKSSCKLRVPGFSRLRRGRLRDEKVLSPTARMLASLPGGQRACLCSRGRDGLCPLSKSPCPRGPRGAARVSCSLSPAASSYSGTQAPTTKDRRRSADKAFEAESRVCHRELGRLSQVAKMEAKRE